MNLILFIVPGFFSALENCAHFLGWLRVGYELLNLASVSYRFARRKCKNSKS